MTIYASRITATAKRRKAPGSHGDLGPGALAIGEWQALGLELPDFDAIRAWRLARVRSGLVQRDYAGAVLTDPINVRYATDSTNMQLWCLHNAVRYAFIAAEGPVVLFDFHGCGHLSAHLPLIDEIRPGRSWFYFESGSRMEEHARAWAGEIVDLLRSHGGGSRRLAIDKINPAGLAALAAGGVAVGDGQEVMEHARAIKSADEIRAMRCAIAACEAGMAAMQRALRPGISEQELWAELHKANIARGGEWIETRLLASGPRINPWFQECSSRVIEDGDLVAFDTDLIGPYGYCADISRTWICGDHAPSGRQETMLGLAMEQIEHNRALLRPGLTFAEFGKKAFDLPERYRSNRYSVVAHGVGLSDEYPAIYYPEDAARSGYDGAFEASMAVCLESYVGEPGGPDGVRLEQQLLISKRGTELLSSYPTTLA